MKLSDFLWIHFVKNQLEGVHNSTLTQYCGHPNLIAEVQIWKSCRTARTFLTGLPQFRNSQSYFRNIFLAELVQYEYHFWIDIVVYHIWKNCGSPQVEDFNLRTAEKIVIAELRMQSHISVKICRIAIAEVRPLHCGIAVADIKKILARPPLLSR